MSGSLTRCRRMALCDIARCLLMALLTAGSLACEGSHGEGPSGSDGAVTPSPLDAGASGGVINPPGFDIPALAQALANGTLQGSIHAAVHQRGLYVFTWRKPGDFFSFLDFPVTPVNPAVAAKLDQIKRHDSVRLKGAFITNAAPIRHIRLEDLQVVQTYAGDQPVPARTTVHPDLPRIWPASAS